MTRNKNPWESTTKSGLVSIGSHKLWISTSGPPRASGDPVVLFVTGGGAPAAVYVRLEALLSQKFRVYFYDRAGYDLSEDGLDLHPTAEDTARDLKELLTVINVAPPYVIAGHSYGGLIAREFVNQFSGSAVSGMVLVDTATELMYQVFPEIPDHDYEAVTDGIDFAELTHLREESQLSDEQWDRAILGIERTAQSSTVENIRGGAWLLAKKKQFDRGIFGNRPLGVVRCNTAKCDYQRMYDAGVKAGNGNELQRQGAKRFIETWDCFNDQLCAAQLRLSTSSLYRYVPDSGHDLPARKPEIVVEMIEWAIQQSQK
ncbi:MAG: hypothetical protein Q9227_000968 [Pyrenula ochraceoflavens]